MYTRLNRLCPVAPPPPLPSQARDLSDPNLAPFHPSPAALPGSGECRQGSLSVPPPAGSDDDRIHWGAEVRECMRDKGWFPDPRVCRGLQGPTTIAYIGGQKFAPTLCAFGDTVNTVLHERGSPQHRKHGAAREREREGALSTVNTVLHERERGREPSAP